MSRSRKAKTIYPPGMHHAWERFFYAITELVEGRGDVRSRLKVAYENHLWGLLPDELPTDLQADFAWIMQMLTREQPFRNKKGTEIAKKIFSVYRSLDMKLHETFP